MTSESGSQLLDSETINHVLNSDASLDVLLTRLKQLINTGEELAKFIKRKVQIEDEHYGSLKKFAAQTRSNLKVQQLKLKQDLFLARMDEVIGFDELLFAPGLLYVKALGTMFDELNALNSAMSRLRKSIKEEGKRKEKECADAIAAAEKARQKYYHLCEDLEKVRLRDPNQKLFSLKGQGVNKEDEIQRKIDLADQDYSQKVLSCKKLKDELLIVHRPLILKKLKNMILEYDIALNVQLQKYATWNENLIMNLGILILPLKQTGGSKKSMKEIAALIDNERDLYTYLAKYERQPENRALVPVTYVTHPLMKPASGVSKPFLQNKQAQHATPHPTPLPAVPTSTSGNNGITGPSFSNSVQSHATSSGLGSSEIGDHLGTQRDLSSSLGGLTAAALGTHGASSNSGGAGYQLLDPSSSRIPSLNTHTQPTFGTPIEELISFAAIDNVPLVVKKCIEKIEAFGLDLEGIYRTLGNVAAVQQLRDQIDANYTNYLLVGSKINPQNVNPADVHVIALLLKLYFMLLPEPLLTEEYYRQFIDTARLQDESYIAKKFHHLVFNLPDGAYFTLRTIVFHLKKVSEHEEENRMSARNLAIIWGPVLMNDSELRPQDLPYKTKVIEELIQISSEIFESD